MAITVSLVQIKISQDQTALMKLQNEIAEAQWKQETKRIDIEHSANWQKLRDGIWNILDQYPKQGVYLLDSLPAQQQIDWFIKIRTLLDSQTGNPVLIEDRYCLGLWRNAISSSKTAVELYELDKEDKNRGSRSAGSILSNVLEVWRKLVLDSNAVSPTGGRPKDKPADWKKKQILEPQPPKNGDQPSKRGCLSADRNLNPYFRKIDYSHENTYLASARRPSFAWTSNKA
jgi:hypothetical protein